MVISTGLRPMRSEIAPPMGSQMKFVTATHNVTSRLSYSDSLSTLRPKVGV
jgi:hypothetical protein